MIENDGTVLTQEYNFFVLESCRFYIDGMDKDELQSYYELVRSAHTDLLIHKTKIEAYFKDYINSLFGHKTIERKEPQNLSELVIDIMLSELDMASILKHVNLGTQEVDVNSIKDSVKLDRINRIKKLHDTVLFFIEYYNKNATMS
jgi:hypothetical protein